MALSEPKPLLRLYRQRAGFRRPTRHRTKRDRGLSRRLLRRHCKGRDEGALLYDNRSWYGGYRWVRTAECDYRVDARCNG